MTKLKQKGRKILRAQSFRKYPEFNVMDYDLSLIKNLNYYALEHDAKEQKKFVLEYWKSKSLDIKPFSNTPDFYFTTLGAVCHMIHKREIALHDKEMIRIDSAYNQLIKIQTERDSWSTEETIKEKKVVMSIQDHITENARKHIGEVEGAFDHFLVDGSEFDIKSYLTANNVKAPVAKKIAEFYKTKSTEWKLISEDPDLKEGYSNFGKVQIRKAIQFLDDIVESCGHMAIIAKTTRAPRKRKPQPPSKLVAKMKWMKEFETFKSTHPEKIIGSNEVWLYDIAKRRLFRYVAQDGMEFSVKGTTLLNWDPAKSGSKIVRKPEILKGYDSLTKRPMNAIFNDIKATTGKVNGRTNDNQIILKVF